MSVAQETDMDIQDYPVEIRPLSHEDGDGFLAVFPDLPGCMADGATVEEALHAAYDAASSWLKTAHEFGDPIPEPGSGGISGKFVTRVPKSLHARLTTLAKQEGVSMNTLVVSILSRAITSGRHA